MARSTTRAPPRRRQRLPGTASHHAGPTAPAGTLGVVVVHEPGRPVGELPAIRGLAGQVDDLLLVLNGAPAAIEGLGVTTTMIAFEANRGTAAAWNAATSVARQHGRRYLFLLDQDSVPSPGAVATALAAIEDAGTAAVVQPVRRDRLGLDRFPWNAVASGSLLDVAAVEMVGGFDERLFVDEVDHELLARLLAAGYQVRPLAAPTITHQTGRPETFRFLGGTAVVSRHGAQRRRIQGRSGGQLVRRYVPRAPATAAKLLLRHTLTAAKDAAGGDGASARAHLGGLAGGLATARPPARAAQRACPYCEGPLLGRFARVPDWRFGAGAPADVYRCAACGALAAGRVPAAEELRSWYSNYYTHAPEPERRRIWSALWPTPRRRRELEGLRSYWTPPPSGGRLLDVGTGAGERLVRFAGAGWDVVGQDLDPEAGSLARRLGIRVHHRPVAELVGEEEPFDLIGLTHVLEHAPDQMELLGACAALLAPGGRICVISPNADALGRMLFGRWWFGLEQPRHLAIPTLESLARLTERLGLEERHTSTTAANAAVIMGGSLARPVEGRLPAGRPRRGARFATALLGQALGRSAIVVDPRRGEEVVWVGARPS